MSDRGVRDAVDAPVFVAYARYDATPAKAVEAKERRNCVERGGDYGLEVEVRKGF